SPLEPNVALTRQGGAEDDMKPLEAEEKQPSAGRSHRARSRARQWGRRHWLAFGLFTVAAARAQARLSAAPTAELDGSPPRFTLTVRVFNYAKVSAGRLRGAEGEAARNIGDAGVRTVWLDSPTSRRITPPTPRRGK